ncbi:hypothetical protein GGI24_000626 [Coemansia furcata]|nr:hypothetical protein GGI24_000626 [Coemansia furcata]
MSTLSPFQTLPILVVEMIIEYVERRPRNTFNDSIRKHNVTKKLLRPLLHVSEIWRRAAVRSFCDNCVIRLKYFRDSVDIKYPAWPTGLTYPKVHRSNLVKRVVIWAPYWKEVTDERFNIYTANLRGKGNEVVFPSATSMVLCNRRIREQRPYRTVIRIFGNRNADPEPAPKPIVPINPELVVNFARFLLRLAPDVTSLTSIYHVDNEIQSNPAHPCDMLLSEICKGGSIKSLRAKSFYDSTRVTLHSLPITGLTTLTHESSMVFPAFARLAQLNARTLVSLSIGLYEHNDWPALVLSNEAPIVFPLLSSLIIKVPQGLRFRHDTVLPPIDNVAPFPRISRLEIHGCYPFGDDVFFRGNGATLKTLRIPIYGIGCRALSRFNVLNRSGVTRMDVVCIDIMDDYYTDRQVFNNMFSETEDGGIGEQFPAILEVATTLKLMSDTRQMHFFNNICMAPSTSVVQHLTITKPELSTMQIIKIIFGLPTLISFACNLSKASAASAESIPPAEIPRVLHEKYYPLSHNFKTLRASRGGTVSTNRMAIAAAQIAAICPSFVFVDVLPGLRKDLKLKIGVAISKANFKPFADSVRHLL